MWETPPPKEKKPTFYSPAPNLPLLDKLVEKRDSVTETPLKRQLSSQITEHHVPREQQNRADTIIICVQHLLETTASLLNAFINLGINPDYIYLMGKCYSTCEHTKGKIAENLKIKVYDPPLPKRLGEFSDTVKQAVSQLFAEVIKDLHDMPNKPKKIILLDDGAKLLIPELLEQLKDYPIFAVEQTTAGHRKYMEINPNFPWISVAKSDLKIQEEAPLIAEAIAVRIEKFLPKQKLRCGIIGLGTIGAQVAKKLTELEHEVSYYDPDISNTAYCKYSTAAELIQNSEYIFGCTGLDTLHNVNLPSVINGLKHFVSCSSEDTEFNTFLRYIQGLIDQGQFALTGTPLDDITLNLNGHATTFHHGCFPINFDGSKHSVDPEKIAVTRAALLTAVYQWLGVAPEYVLTHKGLVKLDQEAQQFIITNWKQLLAEETMVHNIAALRL